MSTCHLAESAEDGPSAYPMPAAPAGRARRDRPVRARPGAPSTCYRTAEGVEPLARYGNNVYHQAELVYAMLQAALSEHPPDKIYWRMPLLSWSLGMLELMGRVPFNKHPDNTAAPSMQILVGNQSRLPRMGCRPFGSRQPGLWFNTPASAKRVQHAVLQACGLELRTAPRQPRAVLFMPRQGAALQSRSWRNFRAPAALRRALERALPPSSRPVRVVGTPSEAMPICEQVGLWHAADVLLTPNGAHFVNAPFLSPGAILLEGVPWAMRGYVGQAFATRWSPSVHHLRLHSTRPPPSRELGPFGQVGSESECAESEICRRRYRDRAMLHVEPSAMLALLEPALAVVRIGCVDEPGWTNPWGKTCADYATPVPPSDQGKPGPHGFRLTGGWCEAGRLKPEAAWAGGAVHRWPERNCCACGRAALAPNGTA